MKNLLHNIEILAMVALLMVGIQSCADNGEEANLVEVNFTATLPANAQSRAFGNGKQVNTLVVGIFNEQKIEIERKWYPMNGTSANICLTLTQGQTYHFIFWAYNNSQNIYDISNLKSITMNTQPNPITFAQAEAMDAFFAVKDIVTVMGDRNHTIELLRPLAQINVGTTEQPTQASFMVKSVSQTFFPFTNSVSEPTMNYTWSFNETTNEKFSVEGQDFNYLAMGYLFAPVSAKSVVTELILTDDKGKSKKVEFPPVEIKANNRTNIAGSFTVN